ncbi:MAG: histone deacetylase [Bacteroidota bacterium]
MTGFAYHDDYLKHDTGWMHPETRKRLTAVVEHLRKTELWKDLQHIAPEPINRQLLATVHSEEYVEFIYRACRSGVEVLDQGDTHVCRDSYQVALRAAGGVVRAVDEVMAGKLSQVFCAVRPPGHHAGRDVAMGFCLFNNVAVGARFAQQKYGVERVAIVDWDVHHGNGTQHIFYEDPTVFYISLHQYPFYPGTGGREERGTGRGEGYTINVPMKAGSGERDYLQAFEEEILPALERFHPELILISAGFDAHRHDPLANINLTELSFSTLTRMLGEVAARHAGGRIVSVLEGGYDLQALARSVEAHLRVFVRN